jgi:hypothetical protein
VLLQNGAKAAVPQTEEEMTSTGLKEWLEEHYGRGQRLAFVTDYNRVTADLGDDPITLDGLENWLYRQPPQGRHFEQILDLVLVWRESSKPIVTTYTVHIPVTAERQQLIKEMAGDGEYAPEVFLRAMVDRALNYEIEAHLNWIKESRKRRRGRPRKVILVTPEPETAALTNGVREPKPNRPRRKGGDK